MKKLSVFLCVALLLFAALIETTNATPVINNVGIDSPDLTITFSEYTFATGTEITDQYSSLGVTFDPGLFYNVQPLFFPTDFRSTSRIRSSPAAIPTPWTANSWISSVRPRTASTPVSSRFAG